MKAYLNISLLAATMLTGTAMAATTGSMIDYPQNVAQPSHSASLTRAEVVAQIPAQGTPWGEAIDYPQSVTQRSHSAPLTRAEVVAQIPAQGTPWGEAIDYPAGYQKPSALHTRTRAEVRAELAEAVANGTRPSGSINYPEHY